MRQANQDPACSDRAVPACRREGTTYDPARPSRSTMDRPFAWPARRIVEAARRFDQAPLCGGRPCHNGVVHSICREDLGPAVMDIAARIQSRLR